jgi:uncharacterized membrane protein YphA (DoxX/SURF4 family)
MRTIRVASAILLTLVYLYAGLDKLFHYQGFLSALRGYLIVPDGWEPALAPSVILVELWLGCSLLIKTWRGRAAAAAAVVLSLFTLATAINARWAPGVECGCWFTLTLGETTASHILQNLVLLGLALSIWLDERGATDQPSAVAEINRKEEVVS